MTKTIPISINGKTVHMEKDWTVLQACEKVGLFIPDFVIVNHYQSQVIVECV